jgi:hypothetical protein
MLTIAQCYDIQQAQRLQMFLSASNIPSFIPDEFTAQSAGADLGFRLVQS